MSAPAPPRSVYEHPEWEAFVRSIRAHPEDDTARLVAADWRQERGEGERAELIRVQVELWARLNRLGLHYQPELLAREAALLKGDRGDGGMWVDAQADVRVLMRRGFAECVRCRADLWTHSGTRLLRREPVACVWLTTLPEWEWCDPWGQFCQTSYLVGNTPMRLVGREWRYVLSFDGVVSRLRALLAAEWPGVDFEFVD